MDYLESLELVELLDLRVVPVTQAGLVIKELQVPKVRLEVLVHKVLQVL